MDRQPLTDRLGDKLLAEYGGAAAAYSLRSLSGDQTKVVRVRRSSDNAEKDFTASEMGAALEDWVAEEQAGWNVQPTWDVNTGDASITSQSSTETTSTVSFITTSGVSGIRQSSKPNHIVASSGDNVEINLDVSGLENDMRLRLSPSGSNVASITFENISNGYNQTFSGTLIEDAGYIRFLDLDATSGATITINSVKVTGKTGFVETWYDQSGNGNDATQTVTVRQPKIVDAGTYLGELDFDGDDFLPLSGGGLNLFRNVGYGHLFSVVTPDVTGTGTGRYFIARTGAANARFLLGDSTVPSARARLGARRLDADSFDNFTSNVSHNNTETLITGFVNWADASAYLYFDGTEVGSDTNFLTAGNTEDTASNTIAIGGETASLSSDFKAKEFIIYSSDQTDNRTAIEANINNHYSIY
jgi:hypothetical protein